MAAAAGTTPPPATVTLQPFQEYRFETPLLAAEPVTVTLSKGRAEIFGAELAPGRAYTFPPGKAEAVFTFHGCALEIVGRMSHAYVASDTPMPSYLQLHARLDAMRMAGRPPRVLVAGPADTGKSSLCRTLANWMARSGHAGTLVDLDVGAGELAVPGALAAAPVGRPLDAERGTEELSPLCFWFGHPAVGGSATGDHVPQFRRLVASLAAAVGRRHGGGLAAGGGAGGPNPPPPGGVVINTVGWVDGPGYDLLLQQADAFDADVIVVIGDDRLHSQLSAAAEQSNKKPTVVKLAKSGGVVHRSDDAKRVGRVARLREYFYGVPGDLCPHATTVDFDALQVYIVTKAPQAPSSALPLGMQVPQEQLAATRVTAAISLLNAVLAVVLTSSSKCDDLLAAPAAGFVYVSAVDVESGKVTLLAPSPAALPSNVLLSGAIKEMGLV